MKRLLTALIWLTLAGCSTMSLDAYRGTRPEFRPEVYFDGDTRAWGFFQDRFGKIRRQFVVDITGHNDDGVLTLDERFQYKDGERQTRTWKIRKTGPDTYEGHAGDIIGPAIGQRAGQTLHWRYDINLPMNGSTYKVHFDDWMLQQDDRVMINRTFVSKFGLNVGEVVIFFEKQNLAKAAFIPVLAPSAGRHVQATD